MRPPISPVLTKSQETRFQARSRLSSASTRKSQLRRIALENLEPRTLLSVLPPATHDPVAPNPVVITATGSNISNQSTPTVAVDPTNPNHLAAAWVRFDPRLAPAPQVIVEVAVSSNGGASWTQVAGPAILGDPTTSNPVQPFPQTTNPTIAFDRNGNYYLLVDEHNGTTSAAFVLTKYNGTTKLSTNTVVETDSQVPTSPTLAIDDGVPSFMDPVSQKIQTDPFSGNIYIAWAGNDTAPANLTDLTNFNPNRIKLVASSDGGQTFGAPITVDDAGNNTGPQRFATPQLTVSQGRLPGTLSPGDPGVPAGQVAVVWDDTGTGATATPIPFDVLDANRVQAGTGQAFPGGTGNVAYGIDPGNGAPHVPVSTFFPVNVTVDPRFTTLSDLAVTLNLVSPNLAALQIQLQAPDGTIVTLMQNQVNTAGNTINQFIGSTGNNLGINNNGVPEGTTFDQNAVRAFVDINAAGTGRGAAAPYIGTFRPDTDGGNTLSVFNGRNASQLNGPWQLIITDVRNNGTNPPPQFLVNWSLKMNSAITSGRDTVINAENTVRGLAPTATSADALGITPNVSVASDNTLGTSSLHQGRLYAVYVDRFDTRVPQDTFAVGNPTDNTDIFLKTSDDGGLTWQATRNFFGIPEPVNDDSSAHDGFSEATSLPDLFSGTSAHMSGRPQFEPSVAVDQTTGTLVISFYDARFDAARARVSTTIATSLDGGQTFGPETFANAPQTALDEVTGKTDVLAPIPDNQSSGNPKTEGTFSYGIRQGLAVSAGHVYPVWSSNENGGLVTGNNSTLLDIRVAPMDIAVGPRIISSTMGPVGQPGDSLNGARTSDGLPEAQAFQITFDRPVDPATLTNAPFPIQLLARDVNGVPLATQPTVLLVVALNPTQFGATSFVVRFTPVTTPGTISYSVGPNVRDMIRTPSQTGNLMDQNANAIAGQATADKYADPRPLNGGPPFQAPYDPTTLPLIIPGPHITGSAAVLSNGQEAPASADNLVLNTTVSGIDVTFDRDMEPNLATPTFTPAQVLQILSPVGPMNGPFTITPNPNNNDPDPAHPRTFRITFPTQELSGTYTVLLGSGVQDKHGNAVDTNLNAGLDALRGTPTNGTAPITVNSTNVPVTIAPNSTVTSTINVTDNFVIQGLTLLLNITDPHNPDLEASLISPDGTVIKLFTNVGATGTQANFQNTVFDDAATTPIQNGGAPFFGRFNPQQPLSVLKNTNSLGSIGTGVYTLQIKNDSTTNTGTLNNWSLTLLKPLPSTGLGEPVADRSEVSLRIFTMDPTNPLASNTWTAVGPASIGGSRSGRIGGLALDPSDPSGNTVFVAGASGGVWKTTDFLTTSAVGPTYVPLTDFGPTNSMNIGGLAVFGRNSDPNQSIVFAATGEGDTGSPGVGVLRSMDGGATWQILDSLINVDKTGHPLPLNGAATDGTTRDHTFVGSTSFKILVDPRPAPTGQTIVYLALSGKNGGVYRSLDTGNHWQLMRAGQVTDLTFDLNSGFINAVSNPTGNLQILYGAFRGEGVFVSSNQAQGWSLMAGGGGDPLIQDIDKNPPVPVTLAQDSNTPNGAKGRIVLAAPALTGSPLQDLLYEGWLYAAVVTPGGTLDGLYMTKDFGRNWTKIHLANKSSATANAPNQIDAVPTNDPTQPDYSVVGNSTFAQGNYDVSLAIDPINPNVVYFGGTADGNPAGVIRVDTTGVSDPYALYMNNGNPDGGRLRAATTDPATLEHTDQFPLASTGFDPRSGPVINFLQDPNNPFVVGATHFVTNTTTLANSGADAKWIPFDAPVAGSTDQHRVFSFKDPVTGQSRVVFGDDQGVFTGVDAGDGTLLRSLGSNNVPVITGSRNGNLQITQFYYGASQPSNLAAQVAVLQGMFYGSAQDDGSPQSNPNIIGDPAQPGYGNLSWSGPGGDGGGVATDQTGSGNVFQYKWPCCGGNVTDFFQLNAVGRTTGLIQVSQPGNVPDPQWPFTGVVNFAVNPINGNQVIISSVAGRIFRTETAGQFWLPIADPTTLDSSQSLAMAYGAPDPNAPGGVGSLDNFIYVGTNAGHIFVTFTGGGPTGNQWVPLSAGLDGSAIQAIVTNPTRSNHEAYAVTLNGVYHMVDSAASGATWQNITGTGANNVFQVMHQAFGNPLYTEPQAHYLRSIQADWRYVIPDNFSNPTGPTHPMLYVAGEGGVYRSLDNGQTWTHFPDVALNATPQEPSGANQPINADRQGGYMPDAQVSDLDLALGNVNPTTGRPDVSTGPNVLLATTYGRGSFAVRLAPITFPNTTANPSAIHLDLTLPNPPGPPNGSDSGIIGDGITNVADPVIDGLSEQSAFGNVVNINLIDMTNPANPVPIPTVPGTTQTDTFGHFSVQIAPGYFKTDGSTDGPKVIGLQAIDQSGTKGNIATLTFTLDTKPPAPPGKPVLDPTLPAPPGGSDSGLSKTDNITNVTKPVLDVLPSGPNIIAQNVELLRDGVVVATVQIPAGPVAGIVQLTDPGPVSPDGAHIYTAEQVDIAANTSLPSQPLTVTFDTVPPNQPSTPTLDPADDTGVPKGKGVTQVRQPHLDGTIVPETVDPIAQVAILDTNNNVLGTAMTTANGTYQVQFAKPLADGVYSVRIQAEDIAGNFSTPSNVFILKIDNKQPTAPTIALLPSDDSGVNEGPNEPVNVEVTNVRQPHLIGTADLSITIKLIDTQGDVSGTPGTVVQTTTTDSNGNYIIQFPKPLPDKTYHIQTEAVDPGGNTALSPLLTLTINTVPPANAPTLGLNPADDTGIKGDGVTTVRSPHLVGKTIPGGIVDIIDNNGQKQTPSATADANGNYSVLLASNLTNGSIALRARATDQAGNIGPTSAVFNLTIITVKGDYDADGKADLALFRPSAFQFLIKESTAGPKAIPFGGPGEIAIQGDFDGDGQTDVAVYQPATAQWFILRSQRGPFGTAFGQPNVDVPVPADFDGDGQTDLAVYRPTTAQWYIIQSSGGGKVVQFGQAGLDRPEPGDYDGDGKADIAVYRPTTGQWFILGSKSGPEVLQVGGQPGDIAVPGNYDGPGKTEPAVYRPSTGQWLILGPGGIRTVQLGGQPGDIAVPGDYDGTGKTDPAIYRPSTGQWLIMSASGPETISFGGPVDIPVGEPVDYHSAALGILKIQSLGGGLHTASTALDLGGQALGLSTSNGSSSLNVPMGAPVVIPSSSSSTVNALTTVTPASLPAQSTIQLSQGSTTLSRRAIKVVQHALQQEAALVKHDAQAEAHDTALATLGFKIKAGRLLHNHGV
jgi:subtilisin-like proprotein convertase family protein